MASSTFSHFVEQNWYARIASYYFFILEGAFTGIWAAYLPDIQDDMSMSDSLFGMSVVCVYIGNVSATILAAFLLRALGSRNSTLLGAVGFGVALPLMSLAPNIPFLFLLMFLFGLTMGIMDVSMNGCAILTEIVGEKPTLSSFHGSYSVAFAIATVFGGLTHTLNWSSLSVFSICAVLSFCCTAMSSFHVYDWNQEIQITSLHTIAVGKRKIESHDDNLSDDLFSGKRDQYSASYNHSQRDVVHSDSDTDEACHSRLPFGSEHVYDEEEDYEASEANSAVAPSASGARASASPHSNQDSPPAHSRSSTQRTAESSASAGSSAQASTESVDSDFGPFAGQDPESDSLSQPLIQRKHDEDDSVQEPFSLYNAIFLSPLFAFSVIGFMGSFGEIAMVSWSIIFYLRYFDCSHFAASFGLSTFMVFMALGRFSGDYCRLLIGRRKLVRVGGVCSVMGVVLIVVSPVISQSIVPGFLIGCVGAAFTGCGLSFLIPTMFSSAGHLPKVHAGTAIATVATFTYSGAIVAPIFVGGFSQLLHSLQDAYILVTVVLSGIFVFSYVIADEIVGNKKDIIEYDAIQDKY